MARLIHSLQFAPAVAHFIREVSAEDYQDPNALPILRKHKTLIPVSYLSWLYNEWVKERGASSAFLLKRNTFSYIISHTVTPSICGVRTIEVVNVARNAIRCAVFSLAPRARLLEPPEQFPVLAEGGGYLGTASLPFNISRPCNVATVMTDMMHLNRYAQRKRIKPQFTVSFTDSD